MADKILGIDLGTNSIGLTLRNTENGGNIIDQLEYYTSIVFDSGVGVDKSGEFSRAAQRTKFRGKRRLYQARRYRLWNTLYLLISEGFCPLSVEDLDRWRHYDKAQGQKRCYPVDAEAFEQWVKLDFDGDGIPDYSSPYQLRAELMTRQFDLSLQIERYRLGRALYHIAQHRGFKSSKGDTAKQQNDDEKSGKKKGPEPIEEAAPLSEELKKSEEKKSKEIKAYMEQHSLPTVGCAFAKLEKEGIRVRGSQYTAVRSQYLDEVNQIFDFQQDLNKYPDLRRRITSPRKDGTIFYKRPLRSQKGNVGFCVMEPHKRRCPTAHPDFEDFRAWSLLNNIKVRRSPEDPWLQLSLNQKQQLFDDKFMLSRSYFKFEDLRKHLEKTLGHPLHYGPIHDDRTINYPDRTSVSGCPVSYRLKKILGNNWRNALITTDTSRTDRKTGETHNITYNYEDLYHVASTYEDVDALKEFAQKARFSEEQTQNMVKLMDSITQGYAMLSLKAIRNINRFLHKGLIYTDAVLLAKIPEILGEQRWAECEENLLSQLDSLNQNVRKEKLRLNIVNDLISQYKSKTFDRQIAYKNTGYRLDDNDRDDIEKCISSTLGQKRWSLLTDSEKDEFRAFVADRLQEFFASAKRDYFPLPKIGDAIKDLLTETVSDTQKTNWSLLYHPSEIEFYGAVTPQLYEVEETPMLLRLLDRPSLGSIKNPVALRTLNILRRQINAMLRKGMISDNTRIVVETARELNDANMRWAIKTYQSKHEDANKEIQKLLQEFKNPGEQASDTEVEKARLLFDQLGIPEKGAPQQYDSAATPPKQDPPAKKKAQDKQDTIYEKYAQNEIDRYRLWKEQGCRCLYTGRVISLSDLFDGNRTDIEHTIPRSLSFDDSLANRTVCDSHFNRFVKQNRFPSELENYDDILLRIAPWEKKVEHLREQVELWKEKSSQASTKEWKDHCIRQKHLWKMELDYWQTKVGTFHLKKDDYTPGFRNSQLVDTRIITKYAFHYLKSAFNHVEVQRGGTTAVFRKMLGVQSADEKKDRSRHSHHAIDAAMLTLVPPAPKRDKMLELWYQISETNNALQGGAANNNPQQQQTLSSKLNKLRSHLDGMVRECRVGSVDGLVSTIQDNLLTNRVTTDRALTPARRKVRRNGKIVPGRIVTGDSIRLSLHKDTYYGAIKYPKSDSGGLPLQQNGQWVYETNKEGKEKISMVLRTPLESVTDINDIVDPLVRESVRSFLEKKGLRTEKKKGLVPKGSKVYLLDKHGNEVTRDKCGNPIAPIRHVRCYAKAGRGVLQYDTVLHIKEQTYPSAKDYKRSYYAQNDGNYLCLLYEELHNGAVIRKFRFISNFEIAQLGLKSPEALMHEPEYTTITEGNNKYQLSCILKKGTRVLLWEKSPDEVRDLDKPKLLKRLFEVYKFNNTGSDHVYLIHHSLANSDDEKEWTTFSSSIPDQVLLQLTAPNLNALIEHRDFEIDDVCNILFNND